MRISDWSSDVFSSDLKGFGTDEEAKSGSENYLTRVVSLIKDRCTLIPDLWDQSRFFFQRPDESEAQPVKKKWDASKETFFDKVIDLLEISEERRVGKECVRTSASRWYGVN